MSEDRSILGGKSVYCINEWQIREAERLGRQDARSAPRIQAEMERLEKTLDRNERAALAFMMIERLRVQAPAA